MKKGFIFLVVIVSTFFLSCSSEDAENINDFDLGNLNFELQNVFNFRNTDLGCDFNKYVNNNGTNTFTIHSFIERVGNNPIFEQDLIDFNFEFTQVGEIQLGQTIAINNMDNFTFSLPYNNNNFTYSINSICDKLELDKQSSSFGQIIITQITDDFVFGTFVFNNLSNIGGENVFGTPCQNYPSQQNYNIINGTFKAMK